MVKSNIEKHTQNVSFADGKHEGTQLLDDMIMLADVEGVYEPNGSWTSDKVKVDKKYKAVQSIGLKLEDESVRNNVTLLLRVGNTVKELEAEEFTPIHSLEDLNYPQYKYFQFQLQLQGVAGEGEGEAQVIEFKEEKDIEKIDPQKNFMVTEEGLKVDPASLEKKTTLQFTKEERWDEQGVFKFVRIPSNVHKTMTRWEVVDK